jgi:hypothetical protein
MKRNSSNASANKAPQANLAGSADPTPTESQESQTWGPELEQNDPTWNILMQVSKREPDVFFARNVVRLARQLESTPATWRTRMASCASFFTPRRLALGAAACVCALLAYPMWPTPKTSGQDIVESPTQATAPPSSALSELVIEETLDAAAEDPTIFTHDEVVAMIGF